MALPEKPILRTEQYLNAVASGDASGIPEYPLNRIEQYLDYIAKNGGSGGQDPIRYLGVTTTALSDGSSTNPITIDGESVTVERADWVIYQSKDFIYNGTVWQEIGDFENYYTKTEADALLAVKANVSDVYTKTNADDLFVAKSDIAFTESATTQEITNSINNIWGD